MKGWLVYSGRSDAVWKIVICLIPTKNKNLDEFIGEVMPGQQYLFFEIEEQRAKHFKEIN